MANIVLESTIKCPNCGHQKMETMPTDSCQSVPAASVLGVGRMRRLIAPTTGMSYSGRASSKAACGYCT